MTDTEKTQTSGPFAARPGMPAPAMAVPKAPPKATAPKRPKKAKQRTARAAAERAPFGWDVVGADGRRIARQLPKPDAQLEAHRISSLTGEKIDVVAAELSAPSVATPVPELPVPAE